MSDLQLAASLIENGHTLVLVKDGVVLVSRKGLGVRPLLELIEEKGAACRNACLGDKVVGRAAALLAVYCGITSIYTSLISVTALKLLDYYHINTVYKEIVDVILNHQRTDRCPMEALTAPINDPELAVNLIKAKYLELQQLGNQK